MVEDSLFPSLSKTSKSNKNRAISPDRGIEAGEHADQSTPSVGV